MPPKLFIHLCAVSNTYEYSLEMYGVMWFICKGKGKGKGKIRVEGRGKGKIKGEGDGEGEGEVRPRTDNEGPEGE